MKFSICRVEHATTTFLTEFIASSSAFDQAKIRVSKSDQTAPSYLEYNHIDEVLSQFKTEKTLSTTNAAEAADCVYESLKNSQIVLLVVNSGSSSKRILEETATTTTTTVGNPNDNVIYVKPDAIFGIGLSIFVFLVAYVGVMCLYNVNTPLMTPKKPFKFGREM